MSDSQQNHQLEQLLHAINHDLRTPLGNIRSATSILLQDISDPLTDDQRNFIEIINHATTRLLDQSNRLMLFSQIAFTTIKLQPTQLSELLANAKRTLKNSYEIDPVILLSDGDPLLNCNAYILSATLALLAAGDTKYQSATPPNQPPAIHTQTLPDKLCFTIHSLMPARESAPSLIELADEIVQLHGSELEVSEFNAQKQFAFCLPFSP